MKTLIAIDSFKGCLSSAEAALAVASGLKGREVELIPVSDGGEGFAATVTESLGGRIVKAKVHNPLGRMIEASYGLCGETAIIESASASGLTLMSHDELDPPRASSRGTGELMADAIMNGARDICIGLGGTGTNDGGLGMLEALADSFCPGHGSSPAETVSALIGSDSVIRECRFTAVCDVTAPFCGPDGATAVYGPQKGVSEDLFPAIEARMAELASVFFSLTGRDVLSVSGTGAAGGLGGALWAVLGASIRPGADTVLDLVGFDSRLEGVEMVITGEGRIDSQTLQGKLPAIVAGRAKSFDSRIKIVCMAGECHLEELPPYFDEIVEITPKGTPLETALSKEFAASHLRAAAEKL